MKQIQQTEKSILIVGIGNDILTDDGIGPRLVNDLNKGRLPEGIIFRQAFLGGMELLDLIKDFDEVIFIDALKTGLNKPGTVHLFIPQDFEETLHLSNIHDIDFLTALELGKRTGMRLPFKIRIIAIEIIEDRVFSTDFSPQIRKCYPKILRKVQESIEMMLSEQQICSTSGILN
ncbi:MAG: hydrogenase maturation protease [Bacteroidales bacterium]|jgi:hydrogenase maturation protease|nr:hydrogenase maturation protease [Bacteroidales bacterium]